MSPNPRIGMEGRTMKTRSSIWALLAMAVTIGFAVDAMATVAVTQALHGTVHAPSARGKARLVLRTGSTGSFTVKARRLAPGKTFDVVVDNIKIGKLTTNAGGNGIAKFGTSPRGRTSLLGVDPRGGAVAVRDDQGNDDLDGDMPGDNPDSASACCLGNQADGEPECEDLTPAECTSKGG